jgi:hypothetical protein
VGVQVADGVLGLSDELRNQSGDGVACVDGKLPSSFRSLVKVERMMAPSALTMTMPCTFLWVCMRLRVYSTYDMPVIYIN